MTKSLVFITGATGFIGSHTAEAVLRAGYRIRLSIRKAEQEAVIRKRHAAFESDIETILVPDLTHPESFNKALEDVDYILHVASPMPGQGEDFVKDYQKPAVDGTVALLDTALKFKQIKKVVIVSSVLAMLHLEDWGKTEFYARENTGEKINLDLSVPFPAGPEGYGKKYHASKILSHQATRDWLSANNPHFAVLTLHPVFVLGDSLIQETADQIGGINAWLWDSAITGTPRLGNIWVHVRDVADAHVKALEKDIPSGTEFILSAPGISWDKAASFIKEKFPEVESKLEPPINFNWSVETKAADELLGMKWRSQETILEDVFNQQLFLQGKRSSL
ncbi:NAD(P)-binding protein [Penicillium chermesinum]|uniref:NAD(P)-binding protein n=1 Tax=Penicillium chermesinum TaxID=63820 RepID=A0A9W9TYA2_9EURO|nr:NAD(P)-binding protein [Penicillium chermesinum]KAJ5248827.1 NAD(P)-binding protein [Penicillium chermesinum]